MGSTIGNKPNAAHFSGQFFTAKNQNRHIYVADRPHRTEKTLKYSPKGEGFIPIPQEEIKQQELMGQVPEA